MRSIIKTLLIGMLAIPMVTLAAPGGANSGANFNAAKKAIDAQPLDINKVSYSIGFKMGSNIAKQFDDLNNAQLLKGFQSGLAGKEAKFSHEEMKQMLVTFQRHAMKKRMAKRRAEGEANKKASEAFLAKNKAKKGVVTTESGLQYRVINAGKGKKPVDGSTVKVTYTGKLINGKVFDSNEDKNNPATFNISRVIPGWKEALKLMQPGATWEIYVPPKLAYGQRGAGGKIGPNQALIFKVHLISFEQPKAAEAKSRKAAN